MFSCSSIAPLIYPMFATNDFAYLTLGLLLLMITNLPICQIRHRSSLPILIGQDEIIERMSEIMHLLQYWG